MGAGLPAMAVYQSTIGWLIHRHRGQARLPHWISIELEID
ncbi:hypothetical protein C4K03_0950 [Pseudomonas synxantha]|uniref:Uncharacterized protein n=1 Tax=Pseudomonas synxantha TaxID=47883 RepID=A0A3G7U1U7_9PSED|nr:hypothetical protein C4K03_0950 [Pseudomonas synxantha]